MSGDGQPRGYLAECYWPGVSAEKLAGAVERAERAAGDLRGQGRSLDFLGSILVPADEIVFWLFGGQEAAVRAVSEKAGVPFERILESLRIQAGAQTKGER